MRPLAAQLTTSRGADGALHRQAALHERCGTDHEPGGHALSEGVVWDDANLATYLADPKAFVPKTKMAFAGLKKPEDVADVIAYLKAHP